jgi:hypothetical protein
MGYMALKQTSIWLEEDDIKSLKRIGKRSDVDREWSWLTRKAMREYIERDERAIKAAADLAAKQVAFNKEIDESSSVKR